MPAKQVVVIKTTRTKSRTKKSAGAGKSKAGGNSKRCSKCGRFM